MQYWSYFFFIPKHDFTLGSISKFPIKCPIMAHPLALSMVNGASMAHSLSTKSTQVGSSAVPSGSTWRSSSKNWMRISSR